MTRVDVTNVALVSRSDGASVFMADDVKAKVDGGALWLSFTGADGEVFAVAKLPADRASAFVRGVNGRLK